MPKLNDVVVVFRTHHWDSAVDACFQHLTRSTSVRIVLCIDETNGPVDTPTDYVKVAHTTATFEAMGLPLLPSPSTCMWHSGDYPLYQLAGAVDFQHLLMIEGDCTVTGDLDKMLERMIADGVDYATRSFRELPTHSRRFQEVQQWFSFHSDAKIMFSGCFATLFVSRRAIEAALSARLFMARCFPHSEFEWVYCEPFLATLLKSNGFKCRRLWRYADMRRHTYELALKPSEITGSEAGEVKFFHPVLDSPRYEQKLASHYRKLSQEQSKRADGLQTVLNNLREAHDALRRELMASWAELLESKRKLALFEAEPRDLAAPQSGDISLN